MRIILSLLFFIIAVANASSELFLNFVPYSDSKCTTPSGVGYSGLIDTCFSFDQETYFLLKYSDNLIGLEKYESVGGFTCESDHLTSNFTADHNACVEHYKVGLLNIKNQRKVFGGYFKVFSSSFPFIPRNSVVNTFMPNQCTSDSSNALLVQFLINGTVLLGTPTFGKSNLLNNLGYHTSGSNSGRGSSYTQTGSGSGTGSGSFSGSNSGTTVEMTTFYCLNGTPMTISSESNTPTGISVNCEAASSFCNSTSSSSTGSGSSVASASSGFSLYNNDIKFSNFDISEPVAYENVYCSTDSK